MEKSVEKYCVVLKGDHDAASERASVIVWENNMHYGVKWNFKWCHLFRFLHSHAFHLNLPSFFLFSLKASVLNVNTIHIASRMLFVDINSCVFVRRSIGSCQKIIGIVVVWIFFLLNLSIALTICTIFLCITNILNQPQTPCQI